MKTVPPRPATRRIAIMRSHKEDSGPARSSTKNARHEPAPWPFTRAET